MISMETALELDRDDKPVEAADAYEGVLKECPDRQDALRNLIGLYVSALDPGYSAHHHLPSEFLGRCGKRLPELISDGSSLAPQDAEWDFWRRYFKFRVLGEQWRDAFPPEYESEVGKSHSLVPYLALFISTHGERYEPEARRLLALVNEGQTRRERDLKSVLESALRIYCKPT